MLPEINAVNHNKITVDNNNEMLRHLRTQLMVTLQQ